MVSDRQVKGLFKNMAKGKRISHAAWRADMCENSARKYIKANKLPSDLTSPRTYKTRPDIFKDVWDEVEVFLSKNKSLEAKTLFKYLVRKYPNNGFQECHLRTLQRRIKNWRATKGSDKEVFFDQNHYPGRLAQSDYTSMNKLNITISREFFPHKLYHFVLTYSNWESIDICFSESFESLSTGFQNAVFRLGCVPEIHQTDSLTAAVNNQIESRDFTQRYKALLDHYSVRGQKTNPRSPNENGDVEQANNRLKKGIAQELMLRGSRDFNTREEYRSFIQRVVKELNQPRQQRLSEEIDLMSELPNSRIDAGT